MTLEPGARVRVAMTKWRDRPHWTFEGRLLGSDAHGDWIGINAGTPMSRPGASYVAPTDQVGLVPAPGPDSGRGWLATFHSHGGPQSAGLGSPVDVYVDITTPPVWDGSVLRAVDLDLDVVRGTTGRVWIDDEDEFARHRLSLGYPDELARHALAACDGVHRAMLAGTAPYDGSAAAWLGLLAAR